MNPREVTAYEAAFVHDEAKIALRRKGQGLSAQRHKNKGRGGRTD